MCKCNHKSYKKYVITQKINYKKTEMKIIIICLSAYIKCIIFIISITLVNNFATPKLLKDITIQLKRFLCNNFQKQKEENNTLGYFPETLMP